MSDYDHARFKWLGKPNPFTKGSGPWQRTEIARKLSGKTVRYLIAKTQASTPFTLAGRRLIEIEGYQGRATGDEMEERREALYALVEQSQPATVRQMFYQATARTGEDAPRGGIALRMDSRQHPLGATALHCEEHR
jgi:hypothetical protein